VQPMVNLVRQGGFTFGRFLALITLWFFHFKPLY
jgi:hypothetical protein